MPTPPNSKRTLAEDLGDLETIIVPPLREIRHNSLINRCHPESKPEIVRHPECFQILYQLLPFVGIRQDLNGWLVAMNERLLDQPYYAKHNRKVGRRHLIDRPGKSMPSAKGSRA